MTLWLVRYKLKQHELQIPFIYLASISLWRIFRLHFAWLYKVLCHRDHKYASHSNDHIIVYTLKMGDENLPDLSVGVMLQCLV